MENAEFLGHCVTKPGAGRNLLPVRHAGPWQAWKMQDGNVMVRALGAEGEPWGTAYLMEQHEFDDNFTRRDGAGDTGTLRSDAPDLFAMWYEQAKGDPYHRKDGLTAVPRPATVADSPWLDGFFNDEEAPVRRPSSGSEEERENMAREREADMRDTFASLVTRIREGDDAAPDELDRLIERPGPYTWQQKYMFTEFGLTLRKLHHPARALACHRRALSLAPKDEHVLFNVARSEYEMGNASAAKSYLHESLAAAPNFEAARTFLEFLNSGGPH